MTGGSSREPTMPNNPPSMVLPAPPAARGPQHIIPVQNIRPAPPAAGTYSVPSQRPIQSGSIRPNASAPPPNQPQALKRIRNPHPHDVLCGRGGGINSHPGNKSFRDWVRAQKEHYNLATSKAEKARVSREIVDRVRNLNPPGRFLQREDRTNTGGMPAVRRDGGLDGWWVEIDDMKAMAKTSQALREGAPSIRAQHNVEGGRKSSSGRKQPPQAQGPKPPMGKRMPKPVAAAPQVAQKGTSFTKDQIASQAVQAVSHLHTVGKTAAATKAVKPTAVATKGGPAAGLQLVGMSPATTVRALATAAAAAQQAAAAAVPAVPPASAASSGMKSKDEKKEDKHYVSEVGGRPGKRIAAPPAPPLVSAPPPPPLVSGAEFARLSDAFANSAASAAAVAEPFKKRRRSSVEQQRRESVESQLRRESVEHEQLMKLDRSMAPTSPSQPLSRKTPQLLPLTPLASASPAQNLFSLPSNGDQSTQHLMLSPTTPLNGSPARRRQRNISRCHSLALSNGSAYQPGVEEFRDPFAGESDPELLSGKSILGGRTMESERAETVTDKEAQKAAMPPPPSPISPMKRVVRSSSHSNSGGNGERGSSRNGGGLGTKESFHTMSSRSMSDLSDLPDVNTDQKPADVDFNEGMMTVYDAAHPGLTSPRGGDVIPTHLYPYGSPGIMGLPSPQVGKTSNGGVVPSGTTRRKVSITSSDIAPPRLVGTARKGPTVSPRPHKKVRKANGWPGGVFDQ